MGSQPNLANQEGAFRHGEDSTLPVTLLGYGEAQGLLSREGPQVRRASEAYDLLLETMGQPRIDPDRRDLFRFPRMDVLLSKVMGSGRRSPIPDDRLRSEFLEELDRLRAFGILEIIPVLMVADHQLVCNEYVVVQGRNETNQLPLKGYIETAIMESAREATSWLRNFYRIDVGKIREQLESENPAYILYLPYYQLMNAYRTVYEEELRERMAAEKDLKQRAYLTIHDRYGIHFLQHVYHRLTGSAIRGTNPLTIDPVAKSLARHPYAWSTAALSDHMSVFAFLREAFRKKLADLDSIFSSTQNAEFQEAYQDFRQARDPSPEMNRRLIGALFQVFGSSLHGDDFSFFRNVALEIFDHTRTLSDVKEEKTARERDELIMTWARKIAGASGWVLVEDMVEPRLLEQVSNFADLLGESMRTGVHLIRAAAGGGKRVCTFAVHETNLEAVQRESVRRARRGDYEWLEPLQALYQLAMENPARSTEALHHAIAAYYQPNQEMLYWHSLPLWKRLWRRFLLWVRRKKHPLLRTMELAQTMTMRRRKEELQKIERAALKEKSRRMARAAISETEHPGAHLPERRGSVRARPGETLLRDLTTFWESENWTIPVTRELPGLLGESLEDIKKKLGDEYQELHLRGNDRVVIPRSYLKKNRERIVQRINAYFLKHVDARGEVLAAGMGPQEKNFLQKKVAFLDNIRRALESGT